MDASGMGMIVEILDLPITLNTGTKNGKKILNTIIKSIPYLRAEDGQLFVFGNAS